MILFNNNDAILRPRICVALCVSLVVLRSASAQNFETGDNSTVRGCSSHCSYRDENLECWNRTLLFFERLLLGQMRHYVAVQINIDQWRRRNVPKYKSEFEYRKQLSIQAMKSYLQDDDIVSAETIETVVGVLMDHAANVSDHTIQWAPHYSCPLPCEYRFFMWRNLFIASCVLNVALMIAVLPFVKRLSHNDATEALITRS